MEAVTDPERIVRLKAIEIIGTRRFDELVPVLERSLEDDDPEVRRAAALAMGRMRVSSAVPSILRLAKSEDPETRAAAAEALAGIPTGEGVLIPSFARRCAPRICRCG